MEEVQKQIEKFLKPAPVTRDWLKEFKEASEKANKEKIPYFPPPINVPNWPNYEPVYPKPEPRPFRENPDGQSGSRPGDFPSGPRGAVPFLSGELPSLYLV
jgi:hypothetical protein